MNAEARYIKPPNKLKSKVGNGGIDPIIIEKCQHFIENNDIEFEPIAQEMLDDLEIVIKKARKGVKEEDKDDILGEMIYPMMQLKGNGGMFRYLLVSDVADIGLQFLEAVEDFDKDVLDIIAAHAQTIQIIIKSKLTGDGGKEGYELVKELHKASQRYFSKYAEANKPSKQPKKKAAQDGKKPSKTITSASRTKAKAKPKAPSAKKPKKTS